MNCTKPLDRALVSLGLLALTLAPAPAARADEPPHVDPTSAQVAALYDEGNALYDRGKLLEAEAVYRRAWRLKPTHDLACNLGAVELDLHHARDAAELLSYAARRFPAGGKPAALELIQQRYRVARAQVGALRVQVDQPDARLYVNGEQVGESPLAEALFVEPGEVVVEAKRDGFEDARLVVDIGPGGAAQAELSLPRRRRSPVPAVALGSLGVAGLATGLAFVGLAESRRHSAQALASDTGHRCALGDPAPTGACSQLASTTRSADTFGDVGIGGLVVAGVAAAGLVTYVLWPSATRGEPTQVGATPMVGAGRGGVVVQGSF